MHYATQLIKLKSRQIRKIAGLNWNSLAHLGECEFISKFMGLNRQEEINFQIRPEGINVLHLITIISIQIIIKK